MKKLVLTLPKSYEDLVNIIKVNHMGDVGDCLYVNRSSDIDGALEQLGLDSDEEDLVVSIYLADEIEFVEGKYIWKLKGIFLSYVFIDSNFDMIMIDKKSQATGLTESELKAYLDSNSIGVTFDAFQKESV